LVPKLIALHAMPTPRPGNNRRLSFSTALATGHF
jgi:hypothetical protein